jgi:hypothetical protein
MSDIVTIQVNGLGLVQFRAENLDLTIGGTEVRLTCEVRDTQQYPVTVDPRTSELLEARFSDPKGKSTTLQRLSRKHA